MSVDLLLEGGHFRDDLFGTVKGGHDTRQRRLNIAEVFHETKMRVGFVWGDRLREFGESSEVTRGLEKYEAAENFHS